MIENWGEKKLQQLAREEMKMKLLNDIMIDMVVCKIEWRDHREYVNDVFDMLQQIKEKNNI